MLPCVHQAWVMARSVPPPLLRLLRCPQTTGLSLSRFYTDAAHRYKNMFCTFWDVFKTYMCMSLYWTYCCVPVLRIAPINNDVSRSQKRHLLNNKCKVWWLYMYCIDTDIMTSKYSGWHYQLVYEIINRLPSLNEENDASRGLEFRDHVLQRLCTNHFSTFGFVLQEVVHLGHCPVVSTHLKKDRKSISASSQ